MSGGDAQTIGAENLSRVQNSMAAATAEVDIQAPVSVQANIALVPVVTHSANQSQYRHLTCIREMSRGKPRK
jgi:hypothetical protein